MADLTKLKTLANDGKAWIRTSDDAVTSEGARVSPYPELGELLDEITSLRSQLAHFKDAYARKIEEVDGLGKDALQLIAERDAALAQLAEMKAENERLYTAWASEVTRHGAALARSRKLEEENERLNKIVLDFESREASVCPEDVGCDEYVPILLARGKKLEEKVAELENEIIEINERSQF